MLPNLCMFWLVVLLVDPCIFQCHCSAWGQSLGPECVPPRTLETSANPAKFTVRGPSAKREDFWTPPGVALAQAWLHRAVARGYGADSAATCCSGECLQLIKTLGCSPGIIPISRALGYIWGYLGMMLTGKSVLRLTCKKS